MGGPSNAAPNGSPNGGPNGPHVGDTSDVRVHDCDGPFA